MLVKYYIFINLYIITLCLLSVNFVKSCNEDICGSIVSKCALTQSCECSGKDLSCYKDCVMCMGKKYFEECCDCVELCPKSNNIKTTLSQKSHVEDFEGVPELFDELVSDEDDALELEYSWNIFKYPVDYKSALPKTMEFFDKPMENNDQLSVVNCTVVYLDHCVSWNKCRQSCRNTGASSYRWFHDGCCECVGSTCLNYGINESRCRYCPEKDDDHDDFDEMDNDDLYEFELFDGNLKDNDV